MLETMYPEREWFKRNLDMLKKAEIPRDYLSGVERARGKEAAEKLAKAAGFHGREGHGSDAVYYGPDGRVLIVGEAKHMARFTFGDAEKALQQAEFYAKREPGKVYGALLYRTKPGPGRQAHDYLVLRADQWQEIAERLSDGS